MNKEGICKRKFEFEEKLTLLEREMKFNYRAIKQCIEAALFNLKQNNHEQVRLWLYKALEDVNYKEEK